MQKFHYVHRVDIGKKVLYLLCYVREFVISGNSLYAIFRYIEVQPSQRF